ncbi:MAG TPA: hypothetical protein VGD01_16450 [Candidatus Elarobacter sp.]
MWDAVCEVNPNLRQQRRGQIGNLGLRIDERGDLFDVGFTRAGHLYPIAEAAQNALGSRFGTVRLYR